MLYRDDLDKMICEEPGCDHSSHDSKMYFHSKCHVHDPTWVYYEAGKLTVVCSVCRRRIGVIAVASKEKP